jgi:hypothetical protein
LGYHSIVHAMTAMLPEGTTAEIRRVFCSTLLIILMSVLWTIFMPGLVAMHGGVFYSDVEDPKLSDVRKKLPSYAAERLASFEKAKKARQTQIEKIDGKLEAAIDKADTETIRALLLLRENIEKQNAVAKPISPVGFHLNPQLLMWPAIYSCLLWLIFVYPPSTKDGRRIGERLFAPPDMPGSGWTIVLFAVLIYVVYEWPTWIRNTLPRDPTRKVFAYPNFDIHRGSFLVQELVVFGFALLVATLWLQWADYYAWKAKKTATHDAKLNSERSENRRSEKTLSMVLDSELVHDVAVMFGQWQVRSVILGLGFVFFTNFFWTLVARYHDQRYLVSAILVHVLWGISWCAITIPLITRWRYWQTVKRKALVDLAFYDRMGDEKEKKEIILTTKPFSDFGLPLAGTASLISFLLPMLKAI